MEQKLRNNGEMEYVLDLYDEKKAQIVHSYFGVFSQFFIHIFAIPTFQNSSDGGIKFSSAFYH